MPSQAVKPIRRNVATDSPHWQTFGANWPAVIWTVNVLHVFPVASDAAVYRAIEQAAFRRPVSDQKSQALVTMRSWRISVISLLSFMSRAIAA